MRIAIICPVRIADEDTDKTLVEYTHSLESQGHVVHLPKRDTDQSAKETEICSWNARAIRDADEVHVFYDVRSTGIHFDLGVAWALGKKIVVIASHSDPSMGQKTFGDMILDWEKEYPGCIPFQTQSDNQ